MAKHYVGAKQQDYVKYRVQGMNKTNASMKAFRFKSRKAAGNYGSRLERNNKLIEPAIIAGLQEREARATERQDSLIESDLAQIKDVADLGHVKQVLHKRIKKLEAAANGKSAKALPTYNTEMPDSGFPPANCSGRTYQVTTATANWPKKRQLVYDYVWGWR